MEKVRKINSYNILRCVAALCVLAYHLNGNEGWSFGRIITPVVKYATLYMTLFFTLSGFVLAYNYDSKDIFEGKGILLFYQKRIMTIFPAYWFIYLFFLVIGVEEIKDVIITFPVQFVLGQEFQHYSFMQNDGVWFLSVMMICYLAFPLLLHLIKIINRKSMLGVLGTLYILETFLPLIGNRFSLNIYTNVFCRLIEFFMGIVLYFVLMSSERKLIKTRFEAIVCGGMLVGYYFLQNYFNKNYLHPTLLNGYNILLCMLLLIVGWNSQDNSILDRIGNNVVIRFFSNISMEIYCGTGIGFLLFCKISEVLHLELSNKGNIIVSSLLIVLVALFLKCYETIAKKIANNIGIKKYVLIVFLIFCVVIIGKVIFGIL